MGLFVIIAGILSKSFALLPQNLDNIVYAFWYLREASVAVYVANMPLLWPMIRGVIKFVTREKDTSVSKGTGNSTAYELRARKMQSQRLANEETRTWDENSSQEIIVDRAGIFKNQTFEVHVTESEDFTISNVYDGRADGEIVYRVGVDSKVEGPRDLEARAVLVVLRYRWITRAIDSNHVRIDLRFEARHW